MESRKLLASTLAFDFTPGTIGSGPHDFASLGDTAYFFTKAASNADPGASILWRTDGTDAGTAMVRSFMPPAGSPDPASYLSVAAGRLFFIAPGPENYAVPWVSDGTGEGTRPLLAGSFGTDPGFNDFVSLGDLAAFNYRGSTWVTDGTPGGTGVLPDLSQIGRRESKILAVSGGRLYVTAGTGTGGIGLFASNAADGTTLMHDFGNNGTVFLPTVHALTDVGGTLYFVAPAAPGSGAELWKSDGTPEGTVVVKDICPGPGSSAPYWLANVGGTLYFAADESGNGTRAALWRSDGTDAGTVKVLERSPGSDEALRPIEITEWSGVALFSGTDSAHGAELWRSDGTPEGTYLLSDTVPGPGSGVASFPNFRAAQGHVFFDVAGRTDNAVLWVTDATAGGTRPAAPPTSVGLGYIGTGRAAFGDRLVFEGGASSRASEPWVSDGTPGGTRRLGVVEPTPLSSRFEPLIPLGSNRVLANVGPNKLYAVDHSNGAALLLSDVTLASRPYVSRSARASWTTLGDAVIFAARPAGGGDQTVFLYRTDGTRQGTYPLSGANLDRGSLGHMGAPTLVTVGDKVYFAANDFTHGLELWSTDGTRSGTAMVRDISPGIRGSMPYWFFSNDAPTMATLGDALYFSALGNQLWVTDGTTDGTRMIADVGNGLTFGKFLPIGGRLLFTTQTDGRSYTLWSSDGTASGTAPFPKRLSTAGPIVEMGGNAYFVGDEVGGLSGALFRSDGTPDGTVAISQPGLSEPTEFATAGGSLYFVSGGALWRSDGTEAGTTLLRDAGSDAQVSSLQGLGDTLYLSMRDAEHGQELWKTDGTAGGTVLAEDVWPGPTGSNPSWLTRVGDSLYFTAADPAYGMELRRLDSPHVAARHVFYNHSALDGGDDAANASDDGAVAADKAALPAGRPASFANVTSFERGINGVMVDVAALPADSVLTADDFDFGNAGTPTSVTVRRGAGAGGSDRVTLVWRDYNPLDASPLPQAVGNGWLIVTVKANARTGLSQPDVFRFGNLVGEVGDGSGASGWRVNAQDLAAVKRAMNGPSPLASKTDFNRDGRTNAQDLASVKRALNHTLAPPAASPAATQASVQTVVPWTAPSAPGSGGARTRRAAEDVLGG